MESSDDRIPIKQRTSEPISAFVDSSESAGGHFLQTR
jgi:hypothetical protein